MRIDMKVVSNRVPRATFLHFQCELWKRVRDFTVDSGASFHMMSERDLTPEEQETIENQSLANNF